MNAVKSTLLNFNPTKPLLIRTFSAHTYFGPRLPRAWKASFREVPKQPRELKPLPSTTEKLVVEPFWDSAWEKREMLQGSVWPWWPVFRSEEITSFILGRKD